MRRRGGRQLGTGQPESAKLFAGTTSTGDPLANDDQAGLYGGFEGYRTPRADDYARLLAEGLVVPDANVLLNLYRYTDRARSDLLSVFALLGERLWVPYQVLVEFWRNRESVLRDPRDTNSTVQDLAKLADQATARFRQWANRVSLPAEAADELASALNDAF